MRLAYIRLYDNETALNRLKDNETGLTRSPTESRRVAWHQFGVTPEEGCDHTTTGSMS